MLDIHFLSEHKEKAIQGLQKRGWENAKALIEQLLSFDEYRRKIQVETNDAQAEANRYAKSIGGLMKEGKKEEAEEAKTKASSLKTRVKELEQEFADMEIKLKEKLLDIPNIPHSDVPLGKTADDNLEVKSGGNKPTLSETALPHWELLKKYDLADFELGAKVSGSGFPFYKGKGARLQLGLINLFLLEASKAGYTEYLPPLLINEASGIGTGQLPDKEGMMYHANADDLYLVPTAEVPLTNIYRDELLEEKELPIAMCGYSPCFRREAGSWGAHVRGLNRLHQFDKVEIVRIEKPENSYHALEAMCNHVESLLELLELPWRKLLLCGGDMGFTSAMTFDYEVWSAAQERWLEVSSVSNFETYQANRLLLRYRDKDNKKHTLHTLNGSALALPRIVAALLENNQSEEGIRLPKVLEAYCGFADIS